MGKGFTHYQRFSTLLRATPPLEQLLESVVVVESLQPFALV